MAAQFIRIHADAPAKPAAGEPCNGCGLCCLAEPCPAGMLVSRRLSGRCDALQWHGPQGRYRCGLVADARHPWLSKLLQRWIGAGRGCDSDAVLAD